MRIETDGESEMKVNVVVPENSKQLKSYFFKAAPTLGESRSGGDPVDFPAPVTSAELRKRD